MEARRSIKYWEAEDKPRERLVLKGKESLSKADLLAIIIGSGTRNQSAIELSKSVLSLVDQDLYKLSELSVAQLSKLNGIGKAKAVEIVACMELAKRRQSSGSEVINIIGSSQEAFQFFKPTLESKTYEEFWILMLNRRNQIIRSYKISEGGISGTLADPKKIFKLALEHNACGLILCHNHPSGNLNPSNADIKLTKRIKEAAYQLDIQLLDHLIIALTGYYSFADNGKL